MTLAASPASSVGERSGRQLLNAPASGLMSVIARLLTGGTSGGVATHNPAAFSTIYPATYDVYRAITRHPTVSLARAGVVSPILASTWSVEADEDVNPKWKELISDVIVPMRQWLLPQMLHALEYGWQPFEKVWESRDGAMVPRKLKSLLPDITEIRYADDGSFAGLKNGSGSKAVMLDVNESFVMSYDVEGGDLYGRSRHEAIREAWAFWKETNQRLGQLGRKVSGVIPIVKYPKGSMKDAQGNTQTNKTIALALANGLANAQAIALEKFDFNEDDVRNVPELAGITSWEIDTVDVGTSGASIGGMIEQLRYYDSLLFRGWLRPERAGLEGQFGTKAEAETHADIALQETDLLGQELVRQLNWYAVDDVLALNFGEEARGSVILKQSPIVDEQKQILRSIFDAMLANPSAFEQMLVTIDQQQLFDRLQVPYVAELLETMVEQLKTAGLEDEPDKNEPKPTPEQEGEIRRTFAAGGLLGAPGAAGIAAEQTLNGAQITAVLDVLAKLLTGEVTEEVAIELLVAVGIARDRAVKIVRSSRNAKPPPTADVGAGSNGNGEVR